jgi:F0F1-type ATP synthase assembly protein I
MDDVSDEIFQEVNELSNALEKAEEEIQALKKNITELQETCSHYESKWFDFLSTIKLISIFIGMFVLGLLIKNFNSIWPVIIIVLLWLLVSILAIWLIIKSITLLIKLFKKIF